MPLRLVQPGKNGASITLPLTYTTLWIKGSLCFTRLFTVKCVNAPENSGTRQHEPIMSKERRGIHLIAEMANVSIGTVDRALHGRGGIKDDTRQRILQIARQIGYTPNLAARALSVAKSRARIGVCMPREIHFFYDQLWSGVVDEGRRVAQLGIEFVHRPVKILGEGDTQAFRELVESGVDGILLTAGNPRDLKPLIDDAEQKGIRVVCVS